MCSSIVAFSPIACDEVRRGWPMVTLCGTGFTTERGRARHTNGTYATDGGWIDHRDRRVCCDDIKGDDEVTLRILDGGKHPTASNGRLEANQSTLHTYRPVSEIPIQWKGPARLNERLLMLDIPVFYATRGEHTKRIAEFIANAIWQRGYVARAIDIRHVDDARLSKAQAVVLGGSLQGGRAPRQIARFVKRRRDSLQRIPSAFFSVSAEAASPDREKKQQAIDNIDSFLARIPWRPELCASFGAASPHTEGAWPSRVLRQVLTKRSRQSSSTGGGPGFTNWNTVTDFAHTLVHTAEERLRRRVVDA